MLRIFVTIFFEFLNCLRFKSFFPLYPKQKFKLIKVKTNQSVFSSFLSEKLTL